jgi:hypothetical protein
LAKFAGKVIVSDALINDNTFEFLKHRRPEATLMLTNGFKKFKDVPAVRLRSEPAFLEKLIEHCNANQPFLFGSDSCDVVTKFFHRCVDRLTDQSLKDKFLLITADTDLRIKDASREWRDKFVFFSPKVTFGVDFSVEAAQDMFIYIKGASINPSGMFQQATRTRNIKTLYYHGETGNDESRYENLDQVYQNIETCLNMSKSLATSCSYVDENDELKFVHNSFFKMFCYNEYVNDVFASNKVKHFEGFLEQNGFEIMTEGQPQKLSKDEKAVQKGLVEQITEELFESFLTTSEITLPKFAPLLKNITYLGLNPFDRDTLRNFQDILVDKYRVKDHDSVIRLLKSTEHVDDRLAELSVKSIDAKLLNNGYQQTKLIHEFGVKFGITIFNLGEKTENTEAKMDDGFFKLVKQAFRVSRAKPSNRHEIKQLFVSIVKAATCRDIVKSKQLKSKEDRDVTAYFLNESLVKHHLELNAFKNKSGKGFAQEALEKFGIAVESFENGDGFADESRDGLTSPRSCGDDLDA